MSGVPVTPLEVEEALDGLRIRLSHPTVPAHRVAEVAVFITAFLGRLPRPDLGVSYLDDIAELLEPVGSVLWLDGLHPDWLEECALVLSRYSAVGHASMLADRFLAWAFVQFNHVGDTSAIERILCESSRPSHDRNLIDRVRLLRPALAGILEDIQDLERQQTHNKGARCRFPVVSHKTDRNVDASGHGFTRYVACTISGYADEGDAFILAFQQQDAEETVASAPLAAARSLLAVRYPDLLRRTYQGVYHLDGSGALHSGSSAGLAMALTLFCEIVRHTEQRTTARISPACVVTGAVDGSGAVLAVDNDSIEAKVDAAFFSNAELLVMPESNLEAAKKRRRRLQDRFPERVLPFRGISSIEEALTETRIVEQRTRNAFLHQLDRFRRRRWLVTATLLGIMAGSLAMWWFENRIDPDPASWTVEDSAYVVKNDEGRVIYRYDTQEPRSAIGDWGDQYKTGELADIDHDGRLDFVFLVPRSEGRGNLGALGLWNASTGETQIHSVFTLDLPYPRDLAILHGRMAPQALLAGDFDADGRVEAYVSANQDFYPAVLMKIDVQSGTVLDTYHHSGALRTMLHQDLDRDGIQEILLGGTNNAFDQAVLVVLDPRRIAGFGPSAGDYQPGPGPTSHERLYLRMPRSEIGLLMPNAYPRIDALRRMPQDSLVAFQVNEALSRTNPQNQRAGSLHVTADDSLRLVAVGSNDGYDFVWSEARQLGLNPAPLDNEFKIAYMQGVERWTPDGWVSQPISPRSKAWALMDGLE